MGESERSVYGELMFYVNGKKVCQSGFTSVVFLFFSYCHQNDKYLSYTSCIS